MHQNDTYGQYYDAIFISTHKFFGGPGSPGILIAQQNLFKNNIPFCPAGGTVRFVCPSFKTYIPDIETKETGGTPDIIGSIKVGLAFDLKVKYQSFISNRDKYLVTYVQTRLLKIPNLQLLNPIENINRQPIFIFLIKEIHYNLVVILLSDLFGIQTRGGISCCSLLAQDILGIDQQKQKQIYEQIISDKGVPSNYGWCRISFHYSIPDYIIEYILKAIEIIAIYGHLFKNIYKYNTIKNTWLYCPDGCMWDDFSNIKLSIEQMQLYQPVYLNPNILNSQMNEVYKIIS